MDTEKKEVVEKVIHEDGAHKYASKSTANTGLGFGIAGTVLGAAALWGRGRGLGFGGGMPENVNINNVGGSTSASPSAFQSWAKECDDVVELTNTIWSQKVNTLEMMAGAREIDVNEKFQLWKSQVDADFGLYKSTRDSIDALTAKQNADAFALYKGQRDNFDILANRIAGLEKEVAINAAIRPYQDKLIQCEIEKAYTAGINYTDRKTCRMISGEVVLPNTPTVTGFGSYNPCSCVPAASAGA